MDFTRSFLMMDSLIKLFTQQWAKSMDFTLSFQMMDSLIKTIHSTMGQSPWTLP